MIPQYQRLDKRSFLRISFGKFAVVIVSLPFFGFIFCVIWCLLFFFIRSTGTHCGAQNYLPSISAAIGNYQPQRFVWQTAILLQVVPRIMIAFQYMRYYSEIIQKNRRPIAYLACIFNIIENLALLGLSLWTSIENYEMHKTCFLTFIATSECYMCITYILNKKYRKIALNLTSIELISLRFKRNLCIINIISFLMAGYFFVRHNQYCESGVYTLFAFFEYIVVLTNMGFHMTAYWDFYNNSVIFDWKHGLYITTNY